MILTSKMRMWILAGLLGLFSANFFTAQIITANTGNNLAGGVYLNPNTGRFWSMDSYEGSSSDPLSLHKYLYAHVNPANRIDPSGYSDTSAVQQSGSMTIGYSMSYSFAQAAARIGLKVTYDIARIGLMIDKGLLYAEFTMLAAPLALEASFQTLDSGFAMLQRVQSRWEKNTIPIYEAPGSGFGTDWRGRAVESIGLNGEKGYIGGQFPVYDGQNPKGVSYSVGSIGLADGPDLEGRYLKAIRAKLGAMEGAAGTTLEGFGNNGKRSTIREGTTKLQIGIFGIPENHAFLLRSTSFRAELARYRQVYQSWIMLSPVAKWTKK